MNVTGAIARHLDAGRTPAEVAAIFQRYPSTANVTEERVRRVAACLGARA